MHPNEEELTLYVHGLLMPNEQVKVALHLKICQECQNISEQLRIEKALIVEALKMRHAPRGLRERILWRLGRIKYIRRVWQITGIAVAAALLIAGLLFLLAPYRAYLKEGSLITKVGETWEKIDTGHRLKLCTIYKTERVTSQLELADSSLITLGPKTCFILTSPSTIELTEGELFCQIAPQRRELAIITPVASVYVLGTEYTVRLRDRLLTVYVSSGVVRIEGQKRGEILKKGDLGLVHGLDAPQVYRSQDTPLLRLQNGRLDATLSELLQDTIGLKKDIKILKDEIEKIKKEGRLQIASYQHRVKELMRKIAKERPETLRDKAVITLLEAFVEDNIYDWQERLLLTDNQVQRLREVILGHLKDAIAKGKYIVLLGWTKESLLSYPEIRDILTPLQLRELKLIIKAKTKMCLKEEIKHILKELKDGLSLTEYQEKQIYEVLKRLAQEQRLDEWDKGAWGMIQAWLTYEQQERWRKLIERKTKVKRAIEDFLRDFFGVVQQ
jgi:hypothetical protein